MVSTYEQDLLVVRQRIERLKENVTVHPFCYLNESDLQAELFALLLPDFSSPCVMKNTFVWGTDSPKPLRDFCSRRLHSELLLPEGRIDLAILDTQKIKLSVSSRGRFGHIQFEEGDHIFIELKATRTNRSRIRSIPAWKTLLAADVEKLNRYTHRCFLLCFDFEGVMSESDIPTLTTAAKPHVEVLYFRDCSGRCLFQTNS
jgi:translation initiation factor IF-1